MKRTAFKRKTPIRQRRGEGSDIVREERPWASILATSTLRPTVGGSYSGGTSGEPERKSEPYRDAALLEMARGRPCLLMVPGICNHRTDTTVAAHSNHGAHGKSMGRKADDCYVVEACSACHYWLDFGKAPAAQKDAVFQQGHAMQVLAWRLRAMDQDEPERFRRAARRAIEQLTKET